ncbi:MAG: hypothetical protein AB1420_00350 [Bacillota bacterium]
MSTTDVRLEDCILLINKLMQHDLKIKKDSIFNYLKIEFNENNYFYSKLLLISYLLFNREVNHKIIAMGAILRYICLASQIHKYDGKYPEYPVLIGDYLYSQFFNYACKYEMYEWIDPLAKTISVMQIGYIENLSALSHSKSEICTIAKESGSLGDISCWIGSSLAGGSPKAVTMMRELGSNLGLVFGLINEKENNIPQQAAKILETVEQTIPLLHGICIYKDKISDLSKIVQQLKKPFYDIKVRVG